MACAQPTETEYVYVERDIPEDALTECAISDRRAATYRDLAVLATEHLNTATCANAKIATIREIVAAPLPNEPNP